MYYKLIIVIISLIGVCSGYQQCLSPLVSITVNSTQYPAGSIICEEAFVEYMWSLVVPEGLQHFGTSQERSMRVNTRVVAVITPTTSTVSQVVGLFIPVEINGTQSIKIIDIITQYNTKSSGGGSCFSRNVLVPTSNGLKSMDELVVGDQFQIGPNEFLNMTGWLHRNTRAVVDFVTFGTEQQSVTMSDDHLILISRDCNSEFMPRFAGSIRCGDCFYDSNDESQFITSVSRNKMVGIYAPYVYSDYFYVRVGTTGEDNICPVWDGQYVKVSPYAQSWPTTVQSVLLNIIMETYSWTVGYEDEVIDFIPRMTV